MLKQPEEVIRPKRKYVVNIKNNKKHCNGVEEVFLFFQDTLGFIPPYLSKFVYQANIGQSLKTKLFTIYCVEYYKDTQNIEI